MTGANDRKLEESDGEFELEDLVERFLDSPKIPVEAKNVFLSNHLEYLSLAGLPSTNYEESEEDVC